MPEVLFDPQLAERLRRTYRLARSPRGLTDMVDLVREAHNTPAWADFVERARTGATIMGESDLDRGQTVLLKDGRDVGVMCAFDALFTALAQGSGGVHASCPHCGEGMEVEIEGGQLASASPSIVFWLGDGPQGIPICDHLNLFPDPEHLRGWLETNPEELGVALPLGEAVAFIKAAYSL